MSRSLKVGIISPYATVAPHFETELELADRHIGTPLFPPILMGREIEGTPQKAQDDSFLCSDRKR